MEAVEAFGRGLQMLVLAGQLLTNKYIKALLKDKRQENLYESIY
jgi:hypothetical protein